MKLIVTFLIYAISFMGLWLTATLPVFANIEGTVISADSSTLKIYPQPNQEQAAIGSCEVGNKVIILEQAYNNQGEIWDRVRLVNLPQLEGWLSDSYVDQKQPENVSQDPYAPENYYQLNQFD